MMGWLVDSRGMGWVGLSNRIAGEGRKIVPGLAHNGRDGSTEIGPCHGRSEIQERTLSVGRTIVPR